MDPQHLPNAPIQEALIDLRCKLPDGFDAQKFRQVGEKLGEAYSRVEEKSVVEAELKMRRAEIAETSHRKRIHGYFFHADDPHRIVQCRLDGFTYNWLRPYQTWEDLQGEAMRSWKAFVSVADPEYVMRIAVRYVNRFEVRAPAILEEYLRVRPGLPEGVSDEVVKFLFRWSVHDPETKANYTLTLSSEQQKDSPHPMMILDIDAFRLERFDPGSEEIWERFEELRVLKNRIFFSALTPEALEMFS